MELLRLSHPAVLEEVCMGAEDLQEGSVRWYVCNLAAGKLQEGAPVC
jgi:hypothetical protein